MDIAVRPLGPGMAGEFFRYFEESAFPPGDPRANCLTSRGFRSPLNAGPRPRLSLTAAG